MVLSCWWCGGELGGALLDGCELGDATSWSVARRMRCSVSALLGNDKTTGLSQLPRSLEVGGKFKVQLGDTQVIVWTRWRWLGIDALTTPSVRSNTTGSLLMAVGHAKTASMPRLNHSDICSGSVGVPFAVIICAGFLVRRRIAVRMPSCLSGIFSGAYPIEIIMPSLRPLYSSRARVFQSMVSAIQHEPMPSCVARRTIFSP